MNYQKINSETIDLWVENGWEWGKPITHEVYEAALKGNWEILLTPTRPMPHHWLFELTGKKVLGLASGGGQQMPILNALGGKCTVLDYSKKQLDSEILVAKRENYHITTIQEDMTKPLPFENESFDLIMHPVSNSYVEDVLPIWQECYRILKPGGRLISGLDNGVNYIFDDEEEKLVRPLPFNPLKNPELLTLWPLEESGVQFSHTLEEQIRGQLKAGFKLLDLYEDTNGQGRLHDFNIPTFWATCCEK